MSGKYQLSDRIRHYLFDKYESKCSKCGWTDVNPFTNTIPLEVHHINGKYDDNREENLELICPNCHALTEHHKSASKNGRPGRKKYYLPNKTNKCIDCGKLITNEAIRCKTCDGRFRKANKETRVSREELKKLIRKHSFLAIGKIFGVTDNAIRKWCRNFNLPYRSSEIKSYSEEEWEKV